MAGVNGDGKGKKDDNGIGTAIDFMLSNAKLVLGVGGAAMLGIATLAVKRVSLKIPLCFCLFPRPCVIKGAGLTVTQMYDRAISAPTSPTKMHQGGKRSWEEPAWMGSSPRVLNHSMKSTVSRSLQTLPTSSQACEPGEANQVKLKMMSPLCLRQKVSQASFCFLSHLLTDGLLGGILLFLYSGCWSLLEQLVF